MNERQLNFFNALLAINVARYADAVECVKSIAVLHKELSNEEKHVLSVAYKEHANVCRDALDKLAHFQRLSSTNSNNNNSICIGLTRLYREKIERELVEICAVPVSFRYSTHI